LCTNLLMLFSGVVPWHIYCLESVSLDTPWGILGGAL
jgi:hypothetical protein